MKISEINSQPIYNTILPSTGKKVNFRPMIVRDERALLTAEQSEDADVMIATLEQVVRNCIQEKNITLSSFDLEYMFIKIRAKSVSELSTIKTKCDGCGDEIEYKLNLDAVTVGKLPDKIIKFSDSLILEMRFPTAELVIDLEKKYSGNFDLAKYELAAGCIDTISVDDETINASEETLDELLNFIEGLSHGQFEMLERFIESIPETELKIEYTCRKCNHHNNKTVKGIANFF